MIKITIKFFAKLKEDIGHNKIELVVENPAKVSEILKIISNDFGVDVSQRKNYMFAKNLEYCSAETFIEDDDELAIIPPVSGGQHFDDTEEVIITEENLQITDYLKHDFESKDGAEVIFLGITRDNNFNRNVKKLFYESYNDMALKEIKKIIDIIKTQWEISKIKIIHRTGEVLPSELSMILLVTSKHRKDSFEAAQFFVDELKKTVPIWKKEFFDDGTVWINDKIVE